MFWPLWVAEPPPGQMGVVKLPLSQMRMVLATLKDRNGGGWTTLKGHGGDLANPKTGLGGGIATPTIFFLSLKIK
jgi:hypothetical protein